MRKVLVIPRALPRTLRSRHGICKRNPLFSIGFLLKRYVKNMVHDIYPTCGYFLEGTSETGCLSAFTSEKTPNCVLKNFQIQIPTQLRECMIKSTCISTKKKINNCHVWFSQLAVSLYGFSQFLAYFNLTPLSYQNN